MDRHAVRKANWKLQLNGCSVNPKFLDRNDVGIPSETRRYDFEISAIVNAKSTRDQARAFLFPMLLAQLRLRDCQPNSPKASAISGRLAGTGTGVTATEDGTAAANVLEREAKPTDPSSVKASALT